jgi:hypothetical protein
MILKLRYSVIVPVRGATPGPFFIADTDQGGGLFYDFFEADAYYKLSNSILLFYYSLLF